MWDLLKVIGFLERFSRQIPHARASLAVIIVTGMVSGVAQAGLVALINTALVGSSSTAAAMGWLFAALCLLLPLFGFVSEVLLVRLIQRALNDLRMRLCRRILASPLRHLEELGAPRLLATLTTDVTNITEAFGTIPYLCTHMTMVAGCLLYLGWLSPAMLLGLVVVMGLGIVGYQVPVLKGLQHRSLARAEADELFLHLRGVTEGAKELKMHTPRRLLFLKDHLEATSEKLQLREATAFTLFAGATAWGRVFFFISIGLLLFVVPKIQPVGRAVLIGYCVTLIQMIAPLDGILNGLPRLGGAKVSARKIEELGLALDAQARDDEPSGRATQESWRRLELEGVTHSYYREGEGKTFTLGPIDLAFAPGEIVFFIGGNGSGKTTFAKILLGLYSSETGRVLLDGEAIAERNGEAYRRLFSPVFADFFLFDRLVGLDGAAADQRARALLAELQLEHKVRVEGGRLSTADLSQGQRKRLALLTAYLDDRPIYLFDEWAADQDPFFKEIFYEHLVPELKAKGKTVFVVSHDDRYYHVADRLIKFTNGQVEYDVSNREPRGAKLMQAYAAEKMA
ncbi:MAG TPA: cyclic peptide export ABC transporter [Thermoanaerobaculia bacterium]|nr:cyclic peptide export ABC transporter [Thermoanaerobaculia bacterium]